ncbi:MAG: hypothetical protein ISQ11_01880 [Planctomycetes bacterium]|nr:hypothetical protein [Planctomycetota bacterium]
MLSAPLALLGSLHLTEVLLICAAALALVGARVPAFLVRWDRRVER